MDALKVPDFLRNQQNLAAEKTADKSNDNLTCTIAELLPKERECCGTFHGSPHRITCGKYRAKHGSSNAQLTGAARADD